jgi:hypothetical protein
MKVEIDIPSDLSEVTLAQYQAFAKVHDNGDNSEFMRQKIVSIFCKIPLSQVLKIKQTSVDEIAEHFEKQFKKQYKLKQRFELGGKEFGFIPSLEDMTSGEFIDLDTNISDWQNMHKAMAVLYRPITSSNKLGQYQIEEYEGTVNYADVMKFAPLDAVLSAVVFFYHLGMELLNATLNYIQEEGTDLLKKNNSENDGDGINQSMQQLKEMSSNLMLLQNSLYINFSRS